MPFIGHKICGAANAPSQLLHGNSYPRTGTFSVISWALTVKSLADEVRLEDCSTRLVRKRQIGYIAGPAAVAIAVAGTIVVWVAAAAAAVCPVRDSWNFRIQELSFRRWNFRSLELSSPWTFVPKTEIAWNFRSVTLIIILPHIHRPMSISEFVFTSWHRGRPIH